MLMKNFLEYILFRLLGFFLLLIGLNAARKFSYVIAALFFYIIPIRKKTVVENIQTAFPDYDINKVNEIAFGSYRNFAITLSEIFFLYSSDEKTIKKLIHFENPELAVSKFHEGKSAILLSAHFGNWELAALSGGIIINIPLHIVVKPQRNPFVNSFMNKMRTKFINQVVPLGSSIRNIYKELKEKNFIAIIGDQRGPSDGIRVNFFGKQTSIYPGTAALSVKTGAPIIFGVSIRQKNFNYILKLEEIDLLDIKGDDKDKIIELTQRHISVLEKYIKQHPEQWLWMHKIWKY